MGGGSSSPASDGDRAASAMIVHNLWTATWRTVDKSRDSKKDHVNKSPGCKTVRLYVSSTFDDFVLEREILAKKVFPELRKWCFERNIHFIDCDLKWGVHKDPRSIEHLQLCLQEIKRCKSECEDSPFFLHLSCQKVGWIPDECEIPKNLRAEYEWIDGLSQTEMEILHAVFRKASPNAMFALRKSEFIASIPKTEREAFIDTDEMAEDKMLGLRKAIRARFKKEKQLNYAVNYEGQDSETGKVLYGNLEQEFSEPILEHFKKRIEVTFPASQEPEGTNSNGRVNNKDISALATGCSIKGYDEILSQLSQQLQSERLVLLTGGRGSGKSAILASFYHSLQIESTDKNIFYHNIEAEPSSSPTKVLLCKLLRDLNVECDDACTLEELSQLAHDTLSSTEVKSCTLLIDGVDMLDDDSSLAWLPKGLPLNNISCVLSLDGSSVQYQCLHKPSPSAEAVNPTLSEFKVPELSDVAKQAVIDQALEECHLELDNSQREALNQHPGASNPQWVCVACREQAASADGNGIRFDQLPAEINSLCVGVLDRLEQEMGRSLPVASLSLLYLSSRGLHETELLALLADEENLLPRRRKGTGEFQKAEVDVTERLSAYRWAALYRALSPYLTLCSGDRMILKYGALAEAVKERYLTIRDDDESWENIGQGEDTDKIAWFRSKLSCFQGD